MTRHAVLCRLVLVALFAVAATGCGVRFFDDWDGTTEVFKDLELAGERRVGAEELTANLDVTQVYPVPLRIACYYEDGDQLTKDQKKVAFEERAAKVVDTVLPPAPAARPTADTDLPTERITFRFSVAVPGRYFLACMTPGSPDNGLGVSFRIR